MAEINVADLSNAELRKKLTELGKSVGPITKSTRITLENKLKKLLNSKDSEHSNSESVDRKKKVGRKSFSRRSSLSRSDSSKVKFGLFSSDEEDESLFKLKKLKTSKETLDYEKAINLNNKNESSKAESLFTSDYSNASNFSPNIQSEKNSIACIPEINSSPTSKKILSSSSSTLISSSSTMTNKPELPKKSQTVSGLKSGESNLESNKNFKSLNGEYSDDDHIVEKLTKAKHQNIIKLSNKEIKSSKLPLESNIFRTPTSPANLSRVNGKSVSKYADLDRKIREEVDASLAKVRNSFTLKKPSPPTRSHHLKLSSTNNYNSNNKVEKKPFEEQEENEAEFVAKKFSLIKILKTLFSWKRLKWIVCILLFGLNTFLFGYYYYDGENAHQLTYLTGKEKNAKDINKFLDCLYKDLTMRKGLVECGYSTGEVYWKKEDFSKLESTCFKNQEEKNLGNGSVVWDKAKNFTEFFKFDDNDSVTSVGSYKPFLCRVTQALSTIFFRAFVVLISIFLGLAVYFYVKKKWSAEDKETRQVLYFVHRIVEVVRKHDNLCMTNKEIPPFLPIPHVRDMLIPFEKRKEMAKTWQKAVDFLSSSDSRIRVETQRISGEDFEVWRWIGVRTPGLVEKKMSSNFHLNSDQEKCWQGPAFDQIEKVVRLPIITPAPCLKIRCMHEGPEEREDGWIKKVEDAVLEKCESDGGRILHIHVDSSSREGCVYVKCDSLESARKAFRSMYGNWFDGRLVIVKFVTLARYHQRFPDALRSVQALAPSGTYPSSLGWAKENE